MSGGGRRVSFAALAAEDDPAPLRGAGLEAPGPARTVPLHTVALNPLNKRPLGEDDELAALAETIRRHGVLQPLVVCGVEVFARAFPDAAAGIAAGSEWVALIGNRRRRAAGLADLATVDVVVNDDRIASMWEVMLVENGARRDLPPWLEAEAIAAALAASAISQRELARRIGRSPMYVTQRLALTKLVPQLREALELGELTIEQARQLGELTPGEQQAVVERGKPYRAGVHAVYIGRRERTFRVGSTPAAAAASIRERFDADELTELIALLRSTLDGEDD